MNLRPRHGIAALTLALASVASVPAFAQSFGHYEGYAGRPTGAPVYTQANATVATPGMPAQTVVVATAPVAQPVAQPVVIQNQAPMFVPNGFFVARTRERMNQIEREAREGVARGQLRPAIIFALRQERAQIESTLARAAMRGGAVRPFEARRVEGMLAEMSGLSSQFQVRTHGWGRRERGGFGYEARGPMGRY